MPITQIAKLIGAALAALVLIIVVGGPMLVGASTGAKYFAASSLTAVDIHGSTRLARAEREAAVKKCTDRGESYATQRVSSRHGLSVEDAIAKGCDCLINQFEDRSSKMQFLMLMKVIENGIGIGVLRSIPDFKGYESAARKHGMSKEDFAAAAKQTRTIARSAIETCSAAFYGR